MSVVPWIAKRSAPSSARRYFVSWSISDGGHSFFVAPSRAIVSDAPLVSK